MKRIKFILIVVFCITVASVGFSEKKTDHFKKAQKHFWEKEYKKAIKHYIKARDDQNKNIPTLFCHLGYSYYKTGKLEKAEEILSREAKAIKDKETGPYHCFASYLAFVYSAQGKHEEAIKLAREILEKFKDKEYGWHSWYSLGKIYVKADKYNKAKKPLNMAIAKKDDYAAAHYYMGLAYYNLNDYKKARIYFKRAAKRAKHDKKKKKYAGKAEKARKKAKERRKKIKKKRKKYGK